MSEFRNIIHYRPGTKMGKPDGLSKRSGQEKSGMDAESFEEGQLLDLVETKMTMRGTQMTSNFQG